MACGRRVVQAGAVEIVVLTPGARPGLEEDPVSVGEGREDVTRGHSVCGRKAG